VNGQELGEPEFNAVLAGAYDVPVVFLSGDEVTCDNARKFIGDWLEVAAVKRAVGRESAICSHPSVTTKLIAERAQKAAASVEQAHPRKIEEPVTLEMRFLMSKMADQAAIFPGAERISGRTVRVGSATVVEAYRSMLTLFALARNAM